MTPKKWQLLSTRDISPHKWFPLEMRTYRLPNGKVFPDYEHIIPLNVEDCNALIEEFKTDIEKGNKLKLAQHEVFALLRYVRRFERDDFLNVIKYKRKSGGRLFNIYSEDNLPIQSFSKEVRNSSHAVLDAT